MRENAAASRETHARTRALQLTDGRTAAELELEAELAAAVEVREAELAAVRAVQLAELAELEASRSRLSDSVKQVKAANRLIRQPAAAKAKPPYGMANTGLDTRRAVGTGSLFGSTGPT